MERANKQLTFFRCALSGKKPGPKQKKTGLPQSQRGYTGRYSDAISEKVLC